MAVRDPEAFFRDPTNQRRLVTWLLVGLIVWGLTDVRHRARLEPGNPAAHKTDLTVYTACGAAFFDDRDPYEVTNQRGWHYLYPPLFGILMAPLDRFDTQTQAVIWFLVSLACGVGVVFEIRRVARVVLSGLAPFRDGPPMPWWIGFAAAVTGLFAALACLQRGQADLAQLYPLMLGWRLVLEGRSPAKWFLGGLVLGVPVAIKLTPILPVGFLVLQLLVARPADPRSARLRAAAGGGGVVAGLALFFFVVPALFIGWRANLGYLGVWYEKIVVVTSDYRNPDPNMNNHSLRNQSLANAAYRLGNLLAHTFAGGPDDTLADRGLPPEHDLPMGRPLVRRILTLARLALVALLLMAGLGLSRSGAMLDLATAFGLACAATLLVSPIAWHYHYVLLLPGMLFVPTWFLAHDLERAARWLAFGPAALTVVHHALLGWAGRLGLLGLGLTVWFVGVCVVILRRTSRQRAAG